MDLAFATGYGPTQLINIEGRGPLVRAEDVVALGYRDHKDQQDDQKCSVLSEKTTHRCLHPAINTRDLRRGVASSIENSTLQALAYTSQL